MGSPNQPKKMKSSNSKLWALGVLLITAGLKSVPGYCFFPEINKFVPYPYETIEIKNALNTADSQQTTASSSQSEYIVTTSQMKHEPVEQLQGNLGNDETILGNFSTRSAAENYGNRVQEELGIANKIIEKDNQTFWVVSVAKLQDEVDGKIVTILGRFPTQLAAENYGKKLRDEMNIANEVIEKGSQLYQVVLVAIDIDTEKKNNPQNQEDSRQKEASISQNIVGGGKYALISGSFKTRLEAERRGENLRDKHGCDYEVIEAVINDAKWYRVSIDSFNDLREADRLVKEWEQKLGCEKCIFYARR